MNIDGGLVRNGGGPPPPPRSQINGSPFLLLMFDWQKVVRGERGDLGGGPVIKKKKKHEQQVSTPSVYEVLLY